MWAFSVPCSFRSVDDNFDWVSAGVYGQNVNNDRRMFWDVLARLISWWDLQWCIDLLRSCSFGEILCDWIAHCGYTKWPTRLNMIACGKGGAPTRLLGPLGLWCGKYRKGC